MKRLVVLASGAGSNLQAVLDACAAGTVAADVVGVVSNRSASGALERARQAGVADIAVPIDTAGGETRAAYDSRLADAVLDLRPDYVVCAGWMRILSMSFLKHFDHQVINLHPALPGELAGVDAIGRAHREGRDGLRTRTGVMVHYVVDEGVDDGPLIDHVEVDLVAGESLDDLTQRVHDAEHRLLVDTLATLCDPHARPAADHPARRCP